jgi:DNA polymerase-1
LQPDALEFNPGSIQQLTQLLFGPYYRKATQKDFEFAKSKTAAASSGDEKDYSEPEEEELSEEPKKEVKLTNQSGFRIVGDLLEILPPVRMFKVENIFQIQLAGKKEALKKREMPIKGLGLKPLDFTEKGIPSVDQHVIKEMVKKEKDGQSYAYKAFLEKVNDTKLAKSFEEALTSYENYKTIETLLGTFIIPLQEKADKYGRIHCNLNFNTDTGRISARKPNLQNQPANDKDKYKIRFAFQAEKGNKLIVADYGQLELRILANITECQSMIEAFRLGGDFHSRTALVRT